jgi:hypothetical protein
MTRERLIEIMRKELRRQYEEGDLGWYTDDADSVAVSVDGHPHLGLIADAILAALDAER